MRTHLNSVIDAWCGLYNPQVSEAEIAALKDTIYATAYQYIKDSSVKRRQWKLQDKIRKEIQSL